jgi:hypothetical protein
VTKFNEDAFSEERNIDQRYTRLFSKWRAKVKDAPVWRRHTPPGLLEFQTKEWIEEVARGNLQRVIPDILQRCSICETTLYEAINGEECSDAVLTVVEDAIDSVIFGVRFDVPTEPPTMDNLPAWLLRWVGSYKWLGPFLNIKPNTLTSWATRGPEKQKQRLLDFALRWYKARLALWPEKPLEQYLDEYEDYLLDLEMWSEEAWDKGHKLERDRLEAEIADWERTGPGKLFLEEVERFGEEHARRASFEHNRFHPKDLPSLVAHKLAKVEREALVGQKPVPPSRYEDHNRSNTTRFGAPAPASELWMPEKAVDA